MEDLSLCRKCKSCIDSKCTDYFEPGVKYVCVNFLEKDDANRQFDDNRKSV